MIPSTHSIAVGVFTDRLQAFKAIEDLRNNGFSDDLIGFIGKEGNTGPLQDTVQETRIGSVATGAVGGGVLGGVLGAAAALLVPGIGPAIAGGIIGATLGGAALGAATGGLLGTLTGMGLSDEEAQYYQNELVAGRTIVTVKAGQRYAEAQNILQRNGSSEAENNPLRQNPGVIAETYYVSPDVSATMPGPVAAPGIYTPEPILETVNMDQQTQTDQTDEAHRTTDHTDSPHHPSQP